MDAGDSSKHVSFAAIGRSGTFIIDKEKENNHIAIEIPIIQDQPVSIASADATKSEEQSDSFQDNGKRELLDVATKDSRKESLDVDTGNALREALYLDTTHGGKRESNDVTANNERRKSFGIKNRAGKGGSLDINSKHRRRESLDTVTEIGKGRSSDISTGNSKIEKLDDDTKNGTGNEESSEFTTGTKNDRRESDVLMGNAETDLMDVRTKEDEGESLEDTRLGELFDISMNNGKTESIDFTKNDQKDDNDEAELETEKASRSSSESLEQITVDEQILPEENATDQKTSPQTPKQHSEQIDQNLVTETPKHANLDFSQSSLATEKERPAPIPAPRKSVSKSRERTQDKYTLLRAELRQRWESIANIPKFQKFNPETRIILQEQADRRLATLCPPNYGVDLKALLNTVEKALERFYDQNNLQNDSNNENNKGHGLPSLRFLQWILPALDKEAQNLLFRCDVLNST